MRSEILFMIPGFDDTRVALRPAGAGRSIRRAGLWRGLCRIAGDVQVRGEMLVV